MDQFQRDTTFTTVTGTRRITTLETLNASLQASTLETGTQLQSAESEQGYSFSEPSRKPRNGIDPRKAESGTGSMQERETSERSKQPQRHANAVGENIRPNTSQGRPMQCGSAQMRAKLKHVATVVLTTLSRIAAFAERASKKANTQGPRPVPEAADTERERRVYNITVEDAHEYYANGMLFGNCDAFRYSVINAIDIAQEIHPAAMTSRQTNQSAQELEPSRTI